MASVADWLYGLFAFLGPAGTLVALFFVFVIDAAVIPALPELAVVLSYLYRTPGTEPLSWALLLLVMAVAGEVVGNTVMFLWVRKLVVDRGHLPKVVDRMMKGWTKLLLVRDERIILVNRIAPVVPFVGAFIAVVGWSFPKSLAYIVLGAAAKYALLLLLVGYLGVVYDPSTATLLTVGAVIILVVVSVLASIIIRRRMAAPPRPS
jgi:membrane protein YqaA with SNARE-associated domain